jgi:hypothetical protein
MPPGESPLLALDRFARAVCNEEMADLTSRIPRHPFLTNHRRESQRLEGERLAQQATEWAGENNIPFGEFDPRLQSLTTAVLGVMNILGETWWPTSPAEAVEGTQELRQRIEKCRDASSELMRFGHYHACPVPLSHPGDGQVPPTWDELLGRMSDWAASIEPVTGEQSPAVTDETPDKSRREQARALREKKDAEARARSSHEDRLNRCRIAIEALKLSTYDMRVATKTELDKHYDRVTCGLIEVLGAFREADLWAKLELVDKAMTLAHYRRERDDPQESEIAYDHAVQIIRADPTHRKRLAQLVQDGWDEPGLRKAWDWVYILLHGLTGQQMLAWKQNANEIASRSQLPSADESDAEGRSETPTMNPHANDEVSRWIRIAEGERVSSVNRGTISRAVNAGQIKNNGAKGPERRIDSADFTRWVLKRANKPNSQESNAKVQRALNKHTPK